MQFWLIVRICQFCVKDKTKAVVKFTLFIPNLDVPKGGITKAVRRLSCTITDTKVSLPSCILVMYIGHKTR